MNTSQGMALMEARDRMLLACLKNQDPAEKLDSLKHLTTGEWEEILAAAGRHGVVPILFHALKPLMSGIDMPGPVRDKMTRMYYLSAARNTRLYQELSIVMAALNAGGIEVILLKGAYLAERVYGNIALRPMADVDLLARQSDLLKIHHILLGLGYGSDDGEISCKIHLAPYMKPGGLKIDVHFDIAKPPVSQRYDIEALWDRALQDSFEDFDILALCPEDLVLHLCSHTTLDHGFDNGLIPYIDLWKISDCFKDDLDWDQVWGRAVQWGMERSIVLMLALTERLLGVPMPELIRHKMALDAEIQQALDEAETMIFEPVSETDGTVSPIVARMFGPQGWREKLGYFRQRAFPSKEKMSVSLQEPGNRYRLKLFQLYLLRLSKLTKRHGRIIWFGFRKDPRTIRILENQNNKNRLRDWLTGTEHHDES